MNIDDRIRAALRDADAKGRLAVVSAVIGHSEDALREIMNSTGELHIMDRDRGMLGMRLLAAVRDSPWSRSATTRTSSNSASGVWSGMLWSKRPTASRRSEG